MVKEKIKFSNEDAQLALRELDEALAAYSPFVLKDQLGSVPGHRRNAQNDFLGRHWSSCVRNAQRAQVELNRVAALGFRSVWRVKTAKLIRQINAQPEPTDFQELRIRIDELESGLLAKLESQASAPEVMGEFQRIVGEILQIEQRFKELLLHRNRHRVLADQARDYILDCSTLATSHPKIEHPLLESLIDELTVVIRLLGEMPLREFIKDPQLYARRLQDLSRRVEEYRQQLARAFRPKSEKNVPQRGRPAKRWQRTRGSGRYSGRKRR